MQLLINPQVCSTLLLPSDAETEPCSVLFVRLLLLLFLLTVCLICWHCWPGGVRLCLFCTYHALLKWLEVLCAVWLLLFPAPQYASFAGIVGLVVYAFAYSAHTMHC
jgi:hypothetical protein